ncbi:hypothetical protein FGO68_gene5187 [Halteria grandinella]|uniref:Uncharacterized protein n=1 Tax=Halteria grandinella TaxID=5974 RepID=A0A8J8T564_HALGN|nr:hypothetical protein FGO68_gene5187 [Halteria grandinella]
MLRPCLRYLLDRIQAHLLELLLLFVLENNDTRILIVLYLNSLRLRQGGLALVCQEQEVVFKLLINMVFVEFLFLQAVEHLPFLRCHL